MANLPLRSEPLLIAPDTFVVQHHHELDGGLGMVHLNSMVIRGAQPIVVDTGVAVNREQYLDDLFGLVEPDDVRWVFLSHEDLDHVGNAAALLDACPNATLITSWLAMMRLSVAGVHLPLDRCRWLDDGDVFDAGDRALVVQRPPLYDSPASHGLLDTSTDVFWAADCFATLVPAPTADVADLEPAVWRRGFTQFHQWNSPWFEAVDIGWWQRNVSRFQARHLHAIASCHGPVIRDGNIEVAIEMLRELPALPVLARPGQGLLDQLLASLSSVHG